MTTDGLPQTRSMYLLVSNGAETEWFEGGNGWTFNGQTEAIVHVADLWLALTIAEYHSLVHPKNNK